MVFNFDGSDYASQEEGIKAVPTREAIVMRLKKDGAGRACKRE